MSRMLTEGVEDTSNVMYENVKAGTKRNTVSISKYSMSGTLYFVKVKLIQIEKNCIILCYVLIDH